MIVGEELLALEEGLGYSKEDGLCQGFALVYCVTASHFLKNITIEDLIKILKIIKRTSTKSLVEKIRKAEAAPSENASQDYLKVNEVCKIIAILHPAYEYYDSSKITTAISYCNLELLFQLAFPRSILKWGSIKEIYSEPFIFNQQEIVEHLKFLAYEIKSMSSISVNPVPFFIENSQHAVGLVYTINSGWSFWDINSPLIKGTTTKIAQSINKSFSCEDIPCEFTVGNIKSFLPVNDPRAKKLGKVLTKSIKKNVINKEIAQRKSGSINLAYIAAGYNHVAILKELIKLKANLNINNTNGFSPACLAAQNGHSKIIELLSKNGANLNHQTPCGSTPLAIAARLGHTEVVKRLLKYEADLTIKRNNGCTPLLEAASHGHADIITELVIKGGADLRTDDPNGFTALFHAVLNGHAHLVPLLTLLHVDINDRAHNGDTALHKAVIKGNLNIVNILCECKADPNLVDQHGQTPLFLAARMGHKEIIKVLHQWGAALNQARNDGTRPLSIAIQSNHLKAAKLLIKLGADIDQPINKEFTLLMYAAYKANKPLIKSLLKSGADVNELSQTNRTAIYMAASQGHTHIVRQLIKWGADVNAQTYLGMTAAFSAAKNNHEETLQVLLEHGAHINTNLKITVAVLKTFRVPSVESAKRINDFVAGKDDAQPIELTPLLIAKLMGNDSIVKCIEDFLNPKSVSTSTLPQLSIFGKRTHQEGGEPSNKKICTRS